jgi:hypothetical protein
MTSKIYCVLTDCSGERATVVSTHSTEELAEKSRIRNGGRVAPISAELGRPAKGERVWYRRDGQVIGARA